MPPIQRAWLGDHWWNPGERPPTPLWPATIRSYIIYCLNVCVLSSSRQSDLMSFVVITYTSIINNAKIGSYIIYCVRCVIITWISIIHTIWSSIICNSIINNQILLRVSIASTSMRSSCHLSHFDLWHVERALCYGEMWDGRTLKSCPLIPQQASPGGVHDTLLSVSLLERCWDWDDQHKEPMIDIKII